MAAKLRSLVDRLKINKFWLLSLCLWRLFLCIIIFSCLLYNKPKGMRDICRGNPYTFFHCCLYSFVKQGQVVIHFLNWCIRDVVCAHVSNNRLSEFYAWRSSLKVCLRMHASQFWCRTYILPANHVSLLRFNYLLFKKEYRMKWQTRMEENK